jgi:cysteine-rich repeat protein
LAIRSPFPGSVARAVVAAAAILWLSSWSPSAAHAHGGAAPDIAFWGPFGVRTVRCLRVISQATRACFDQVLAAERECAERELGGESCDAAARDTRIAAAQGIARAAVENACLGGQLTELYFVGFDDAKADVLRGCSGEVDAAMSVLYRTDAAPTALQDLDASGVACMRETAALGRKLLRFTIAVKTRALERIAFKIANPSAKHMLIDRAEATATRARQQLADRLARTCPEFETIYASSPLDLLQAVGRRANCVVQATHFQTAVSCPRAECGNAIREPGEACDDGNQVDTDSCRNDCTENLEVAPSAAGRR